MAIRHYASRGLLRDCAIFANFCLAFVSSSIAQASDEELQLYLLQLVQALKYDNYKVGEDKKKLSISRNNSVNVEDQEEEFEDLSSFLISRASNHEGLANYLYWYLKIETEEEDNVNNQDDVAMYKEVLEIFLKETKFQSTLERQSTLINNLVQLLSSVSTGSEGRPSKIKKMQQMLMDQEQFKFDFSSFEPLPLPTDPSINISGIEASEAHLFKSSLMPAKLTFTTPDQQKVMVIFKNGDDLRQDQLILQIISVMDQLLKKENLDLKLSPYRVLATSSKHGMMEYVDAIGISDILKSKEGSILNYFRKYNP